MKIFMIGEFSTASWNGSATQKVIRNISENLALLGHEIIGIEKNKGTKYKTFFSATSITKSNGYIIVKGGIIPLIFYMATSKYDVLFFNVIRNYQIIWLPFLLVLGGVKTALFHDILDFISENKNNRIFSLTHYLKEIYLHYFDCIFVLNQKDQQKLYSINKAGKIIVVPNGVDSNIYCPNKSAALSNLIINSSGLGFWYKGLEFNEKSLEKVKSEFQFKIIGKNPFGMHHVGFIGELNEIEYLKLLQESRIVIVSSFYDSFSLVALEAMACGTPVILTENCGISENLTDRNGCFIIAYEDDNALTDRIEKLLSDNNLWNKMSEDAIDVSKKFSWKVVALKYEAIFKGLLSE